MTDSNHAYPHGKCAAHQCRQWATEWAWFEDGPVTAKVWLCRVHFDEWAAPRIGTLPTQSVRVDNEV